MILVSLNEDVENNLFLLLVPNGFYFGRTTGFGSIEYTLSQTRDTEHDIIAFGLQTYSSSIEIFRLESDLKSYYFEYDIVCVIIESYTNIVAFLL